LEKSIICLGSRTRETPAILARKAYTYLMPSCQTVRSFEPLEHRKAWSPKKSTRGAVVEPYG
jgi:hypothetical protein